MQPPVELEVCAFRGEERDMWFVTLCCHEALKAGEVSMPLRNDVGRVQ